MRANQPAVEPVTQGRGIYRCRRAVHGECPWYAVTSDGGVLDPMRRRPDETDAEIVVRLADRLDEVDPVLRLVTPSRDSASRPHFWMHGLRPLCPSPVVLPRLSVSGRSRG